MVLNPGSTRKNFLKGASDAFKHVFVLFVTCRFNVVVQCNGLLGLESLKKIDFETYLSDNSA